MSVQVVVGDAREVLRTLPDASVHCCVTSPPYFGLRDYGTGYWDGGDPDHAHDTIGARGGKGGSGTPDKRNPEAMLSRVAASSCICGAIRVDKQMGLEATPELWVQGMVEVFCEVRRVLRPDGTLWLNIGDSYAGSGKGPSNSVQPQAAQIGPSARNAMQFANGQAPTSWIPVPTGCKAKDLIGIPWMLAFALRADGWWLRADIIWSKPNPMPESVTDRPTKAHEYLFLLSKSRTYYYDADAIREDMAEASAERYGYGFGGAKNEALVEANKTGIGQRTRPVGFREITAGRNKRSVWTVATEAFSEAHFATYPTALIEPCIKAGTSERGCCPECGAPWVREREPTEAYKDRLAHANDRGDWYDRETTFEKRPDGTKQGKQEGGITAEYITTGWRASCGHAGEPVPCTVLDPFFGAGTTGLVSDRLNRNCIGIEINPTYAEMARRRITGDSPMFTTVDVA